MNLYEAVAFVTVPDANVYNKAKFVVPIQYVLAKNEREAERKFLLQHAGQIGPYEIEEVTILVRPFCWS